KTLEQSSVLAERAHIGGNLSFRNALVEADIALSGATIGGNVQADGGVFDNPEGTLATVSGDALKVKGGMFFRDGARVQGVVELDGASIGGQFVWARLEKPEESSLQLAQARIGMLVMTPESWPRPDNLILSGLVYDRIMLGDDHSRDLEWVRLQQGSAPSSYDVLAGALRKEGLDDEARTVL